MASARVTHYHLTTNADPDVVAQLLSKAWERYHAQWWATFFLRGTASINEKGNHTYLLNNYNGAFTVKITGDKQGSTVDTVVHRTRTTQQKVMLVPIFPKTVHVATLIKKVIAQHLYDSLIASGYTATLERQQSTLR